MLCCGTTPLQGPPYNTAVPGVSRGLSRDWWVPPQPARFVLLTDTQVLLYWRTGLGHFAQNV
eukprot:2740052-Rhodomonas_salina.1